MTVDHLISFPTEAEALAAFAGTPYASEGENGPQWNASIVFPGLTLVVVPAEYDAEGNQTQAQQNFPGFWLLISTTGDGPDPTLAAMESTRIVANREAALAGQPFIYGGESLRADPAQIASVVRIDGLPAGSAYPFSAPSVIED